MGEGRIPEDEADFRYSSGNEERALSTGRVLVWLLLLVIGVVLVVGLINVAPTELPQSSESGASEPAKLNTTETRVQVIEKINQKRVERGLSPVEEDSELNAVARNHSQDMALRDYYGHETPDGLTPWDRVRASDAECELVGENIAATWWKTDFESHDGDIDRYETVDSLADGLVEQWLNSPDHRENMLDDRWGRTGVGVVITDEGEVIVTQKFCE